MSYPVPVSSPFTEAFPLLSLQTSKAIVCGELQVVQETESSSLQEIIISSITIVNNIFFNTVGFIS